MIKRILLLFLGLLVVLIGVLLVNTFRFSSTFDVSNTKTAAKIAKSESTNIANHLAEAIRFRTISSEDANDDYSQEFARFTMWLQNTYPQVFSELALTRINQHTLLLHWAGKTTENAALLSAHYDVVPVNPGTEQQWQYPPFSGTVADGYIWGRGALDDKSAVIAIMEAVTSLLNEGHRPSHDLYLAFTHDEEIGSSEGAAAVTQWFKETNTPLAWSLDEGSFVLSKIVPGIDNGIASINLGEKGYLTLKLTAKGEGGHSSMPPPETAVSTLAQALVKLNHASIPGGLTGITEQMYTNIAKHMDFSKRMLFANLWLFRPLLENVLDDTNSGNAMLHTTIAPTMLTGSIKSNVLPATATATINFRLHPRDSVADIVGWVNHTIGDNRVTVEILEAFEPSPLASTATSGFAELKSATTATYPNAIVTPGLTIAATDSRFYAEVTDAYRFNPMVITNEDLNGFHGTNERISIENMANAVRFYRTLLSAH